ncbi:MAG TPA: cation:proton antiporter [Miltoncostaeaceae bacterium]|nr:cation:proton antiporter [Miltoncostaeaceae bacterium]
MRFGSAPPAAITPGFEPADAWSLGLVFLGVAVMAAIVALTHQRSRAFSPSVVYLALGALGAVGLAALDHDWFSLVGDAELVERFAELAVIVALFATGVRLDRPFTWRGWRSTIVLLGVVMPVTIAAVAAFGVAAMGLSAGAAIVLGAALAPTDPVLAGDLGVGPPGEEDEAGTSFALTSEAGLNDGLAFPFVYLGLAVAGHGASAAIGDWIAWDVAYAIAGGVLIGAAGGWAIAEAATRLRERSLLAVELDGWAALGAVLAIYGVAQVADTYGFLAAFVGGVAFRRRERDHEYARGVHAGGEVLERVLELATILFLGSLLTLDGLAVPGVAGWLLAPFLLLLVRPLTSIVALRGTELDARERLWVGWFGVRGVGSLYYAAAALQAGILAAGEAETVMWTVVAVVAVSIVVHGVTGTPLTRRLGRDLG